MMLVPEVRDGSEEKAQQPKASKATVKKPPTVLKMLYFYQWLVSGCAEDRKLEKPITPPSNVRWALLYLNDNYSKRMKAEGGLPWKVWNGLYSELREIG